MFKYKFVIGLCFLSFLAFSQLSVFRDTISVFENGSKLNNAWAGGINFVSFSNVDINLDGKLDIAIFDKVCNTRGQLRLFKNVGSLSNINYKRAPEFETQLPVVEDWALFYDYNNDGKQDLFTYVTSGIKVYKNTSTPGAVSFVKVSNLLRTNYNPFGAPNMANIYSNSIGSPGFSDIDNDGDLDILTFSVSGFAVEWHKNMSMELYGHSDSLVYQLATNCWGNFAESSCGVQLNNNCAFKLNNSDGQLSKKVLHSGSCIMCFDRNNDGDKDLALGDVSCNQIIYLENGGSSTIANATDTTLLFPTYPAKTSFNAVKLNSFPCAYNLDVDNDGSKDIIVTPNATAGAENAQSVWYYKNTASGGFTNFSLQSESFLQNEMMEFGEGAFPVLFDADSDGLEDLIVGNMGYYLGGTNLAKLAYYKNTGTAIAPTFSLITKDYQNFSSLGLLGAYPTFGDLDNDGDKDLIIGTTGGKLHYYENIASTGAPAVFANHVINYQNIIGAGMASPQLFDMDGDGDLDLLMGTNNGKIYRYNNKGSATNPVFDLITSFFGGVNTKPYGYSNGLTIPYFFKDAGVTKLLVGTEFGTIYYYNNIDGNLTGNFNRVDTNLFNINEGARCAAFYKDITADGLRDLIVGNYAGGLAFFNSIDVNGVGVKEVDLENYVTIYPNPSSKTLYITINNEQLLQQNKFILIDMFGKEMLNTITFNKKIELNISDLKNGVYFLQYNNNANNKSVIGVKKIIIVN